MPKTKYSFPRTRPSRNSVPKPLIVLAAAGLLWVFPGCRLPAEQVWGYTGEQLLTQLNEDPQKVIEALDYAEINPREALRLGNGAPYYLGLHFRTHERSREAEKLLRLAAVTGEALAVKVSARTELLELLLEEGQLREAERSAGRFLAEGRPRAAYAVSLFEALFRRGKVGPLAQALEEYGSLFSEDSVADVTTRERARYRFYRFFTLYIFEREGWKDELLSAAARIPHDALPPQWYQFVSGAGEGAYRMKDAFPEHARLDTGRLSEGAVALLNAKHWQHQGAYRRAAEEYRRFVRKSLPQEQLRRSFDKVVFDELVRASLYSGSVEASRSLFDRLAGRYSLEKEKSSGTEPESEQQRQLFWVLETRGYLNRRAGRFRSAAEDYQRALSLAPEGERERMRWYRYDSTLRYSTEKALSVLRDLSAAWEDPVYYDDVLFDLADRLVEARNWGGIAEAAQVLVAAQGSVGGSRLAYLAARAAERGHVEASGEQITAWYRSAAENSCGVEAGLYYRILAIERLVFRGGERAELYGTESGGAIPPFCSNASSESEKQEPHRYGVWRAEAAKRIRGYLRFGLAEFAYSRYGEDKEFLSRLDSLTVRSWTMALRERGEVFSSIRLLSRYLRRRGGPVSLAEAKLLYPRPYREPVSRVGTEYGVPEYIFYGLLREESYFDTSISSSAGAVGLAQLMPETARDVASRLGLRSYDLTDPEINVRLGGWYLHHLRGRTDTYLRALFAYNGGLTRVRRWKKENAELPEDLLLEAVPYAETKHYGRKVLVSSVVYGYLYHERTPGNVVEEIFGVPFDPNDE